MGRRKGLDAGEFTALSERMNYLQSLRVGFVVIILSSAALASSIVGASFADLVLASSAYLALAGLTEALRRVGKGRALPLVAGMLIVDGLFLAWAMYATGGTQSPLRFLPYLHLIGVTLLASYRTGLKIALWHSLLFFVVFFAQAARLIDPADPAASLDPSSPEFSSISVFNVMALWLVAVGTAAFSSLNERELRRRKGDLEDLAAMAAAIENETDPNGIANVLLQGVGDSFGFSRGVVVGIADDRMTLLARRGPGDVEMTASGAVDRVVGQALETRQPALVKKLDDALDPALQSLLPFARNLVVVPLIAEGEPLGALVVEHPQNAGGRVERRVVQMVQQFASHGALALRNSHLMQRVQVLADTDALTGIANRRTFEAALERELSRSSRNGEPLTLMMVDVDHFKKFNDTYGHQAGDDVLRLVAGALRSASRDFDTPARYGGEEFAVILPACSSAESIAVAERLRGEVSNVEAVARVTASAGVATFPAQGVGRDELIRLADSALYWAKEHGKNRVRVYRADALELAALRRLADGPDRAARLRAAANLAKAVDARDVYTRSHSQAVGEIAGRIATRMGLDPEDVQLVRLAGRLHDLGKLAIPEEILRKPAPLDDTERLVLERHPQIGFGVLDSLGIEPVGAWVLHHHERWDGKGYPSGLAGELIPLGSRIVLVADAYDAMTNQRTYRGELPHEEAVEELIRCAGTQFDPAVVDAFRAEFASREAALAGNA